MINYLDGKIEETFEDSIVIDVNGIGYEVFVPNNFLPNIPKEQDIVRVYTYQAFREDGQSLYGFLNKKDKDIFKSLISVSGIGPKGGLAILSHLKSDVVIEAVIKGDDKLLATAPGIGKKTASRMVLELREKFGHLSEDVMADGVSSSVNMVDHDIKEDAKSALMALGYGIREIQKSITALSMDDLENVKSTEDLIRLSLKKLR
jgi:holliday junction DNA helicase RuvA